MSIRSKSDEELFIRLKEYIDESKQYLTSNYGGTAIGKSLPKDTMIMHQNLFVILFYPLKDKDNIITGGAGSSNIQPLSDTYNKLYKIVFSDARVNEQYIKTRISKTSNSIKQYLLNLLIGYDLKNVPDLKNPYKDCVIPSPIVDSMYDIYPSHMRCYRLLKMDDDTKFNAIKDDTEISPSNVLNYIKKHFMIYMFMYKEIKTANGSTNINTISYTDLTQQEIDEFYKIITSIMKPENVSITKEQLINKIYSYDSQNKKNTTDLNVPPVIDFIGQVYKTKISDIKNDKTKEKFMYITIMYSLFPVFEQVSTSDKQLQSGGRKLRRRSIRKLSKKRSAIRRISSRKNRKRRTHVR
jgi:hypothetical protein